MPRKQKEQTPTTSSKKKTKEKSPKKSEDPKIIRVFPPVLPPQLGGGNVKPATRTPRVEGYKAYTAGPLGGLGPFFTPPYKLFA